MSDEYLNGYPSAITIDVALEEKTRIAKMAAATLHKLHNVVQQMRDWRNDSAKLKSNIWRMKMALRADDKNGNDNLQIDPLIVHQKTEISRLEQVNDALENEVASLRSALTTTEEDIARITAREMGDKISRIKDEFSDEKEQLDDEILCLRKRLREAEQGQTSVTLKELRDKLHEFARADRTIEMIFANMIGKVAEIVVDLSERLVSVSEDLYRFKSKNENLHLKLDKLRSMLRSRSGSSAEYRKRIGELNNLAEQLKVEMDRLKVIRENVSCSESLDAADIPDIVRRVERLMNDLKNNLKNDREAMIAAGDPDCLEYMKKVVDIKVNLKVMSVELRRSNVPMQERSCEDAEYERCMKAASLLNDFLNEIDIDIGKLKVRPMDRYCRIGGVSGTQYTAKIIELEEIVKKSTAAISALKQTPLEDVSTKDKPVVEFEELIERLYCKMKDLEICDDRSTLREKIGQLEESIAYLRLKLTEKDSRITVLKNEYTNVISLLERDRKKLENAERIMADMRGENEGFKEDIEKGKQEILKLSHKRGHSEERVAEMRLMKVEIDVLRKKLQELHRDKETLSEETGKMRNILQERDKEIANIVSQRDTQMGALRTEVKDLKMKLWIASDENVKLKGIIEGLGKQEEAEWLDKLKSSGKEDGGDKGECSRDCARNLRHELERAKAESNESKISLSEANKRIDHLKCTLDETVGDRTKLENEISNLRSNEESLTHRLNVQRSSVEEISREFERVTAEKEALESKFKHLRNEKEQLKAELSELRSEKGLLDRSIADANNKCTTLQDQVNKFKSERNGLRQKISEHEAATENLKFRLERVRTELEETTDKIDGLKSENSRLAANVDILSLRSIETENRVQTLLTEKKELLTHVNEHDEESIILRDQLNKAKTENECLSAEVNKSKIEHDKMKERNTLLQVTCDKRERDIRELTREKDLARKRFNEINSEYRILDDQLRILQMKYSALRIAVLVLYHENNDRKGCLRKIDTRYPLLKELERAFANARNEVEHKRNYPDTAYTSVSNGIDERKDDETELKVESDTCAGRDNKVKIKDKPKGGLKRLRTENKALKSELANLRSENSEITTELARTKDESERPIMRTDGPNDQGIIGSILNKLEIVDVCFKKEINNCFSYSGEPMSEGKRTSTMIGFDRLELENIALKKEVDILRNGLNFNLVDGEKTKTDLGRAIEEIQALKLELMSLRAEKAALRSRLEMLKAELNELKSERIALKDELAASRKSNFDLRLKANDLRSANEKLRETNVGLEIRLRNVSRELNKYTVASEEPYKSNIKDDLASILNDDTRKYDLAKENLRTINKQSYRLERVPVASILQSIQKNLQHIEGID